jgi:plastocyanin
MKADKRVVAATVAATALIMAGCGGGSDSQGSTPATVGAIDVTVHAIDPKYGFDSKQYTAKAGTVNVQLVDDGHENHTLLIQGVATSKFKLSVIGQGSTKAGSIDLAAGTYTIYCNIAGHRGAGMEAKLIVS